LERGFLCPRRLDLDSSYAMAKEKGEKEGKNSIMIALRKSKGGKEEGVIPKKGGSFYSGGDHLIEVEVGLKVGEPARLKIKGRGKRGGWNAY